MKERLQKRIAHSGITSRRKAEELIKAGKVSVNGQKVIEMGYLVDDMDVIKVNGKLIDVEKKVYYMLNKPRQVLSSVSDDRGRKVVTDLIKVKERIYPVGRLDYETTGLIILTNDGEFANRMIHPRYHLPKMYHVKIEGILTNDDINRLSKGLTTKEERYQRAIVENVRRDKKKKVTHFDMTIFEGKNRQIRLMMEFLGYDVLALSRLSIGPLTLDKLPSGKYRALTNHEIKLLNKAVNQND
ncbi:MAG: rRNA pseudouridine synthase [Erysipelothrix sp.]|nr:rRNA pseudouridine synthase [Erysipelothrix sp.]